jgi:hypothetical protein
MENGQTKSSESSSGSSAGSSTESMGRQEETRTSRDAGPYLVREWYSRAGGGWGLGV